VLNAAETLEQQLEFLVHQDYVGAWEIIVSDNGSTDGSAEIARGWSDRLPDLRVIDAQSHTGISHARNAAIAVARGDFLTFSDADDNVTPGWLSALADAARDADMVGGWDVSLNDEDNKIAPAGLQRLLDFLPYAVGNNCGVWATILEAVGGWNEEYRRSNDVELSWRVQSRGYTLGFAKDAIVQKRCRATGRELVTQFYGWGYADAQLYRDFRDQGVARSSVRTGLVRCIHLIVHFPDVLRAGTRRGEWLKEAAHQWGRIRGSLNQRVLYP
jgi:glycosyltransferase involved in cell wall biosynthesis